MTSKKKVDQSGFQLDEHLVDGDLPMLAKPLAHAFIAWLNSADLNNDGKADIEEIEPIMAKAAPHVTALAKYIDWSAFGEWLLKQDFFVHNDESKAVIVELEKLGAEALSVATQAPVAK